MKKLSLSLVNPFSRKTAGAAGSKPDYAVLLGLSLGKLAVHLLVNATGGYGIFRDELYYLACSNRLDWGYVDHPPLSILFLRLSRWVFGDSLPAIRLLPALAGACTVWIVCLMVKRMGGGRFAQMLAGLSLIVAPAVLALNNFYSMNSFDLLFWALAAYLVIRIIDGGTVRLWLGLGLVMGCGFMNKISLLWFMFGLALGVLLTSQRKALLGRAPWLAGLTVFLCGLPFLIWQMAHGWPTWEFMNNALTQKMASHTPGEFIFSQVMQMHPATLPVWALGLYFYLVSKQGKRFRLLGIIFAAVFLLLIVNQKSRPGYLVPAYSLVFAGGAVFMEKIFSGFKRRGVKTMTIAGLIAAGIVTAPLSLPILPVEKYLGYAKVLGQAPATNEKKELGKLPQHLADMFGWEKMAAVITGIYKELTPEERAGCAIFTGNYGEAGAIDYYGKPYGLPGAVSGHNNYWLWGPGAHTAEVMISFGGPPQEVLRLFFREVTEATVFVCAYCMPYENGTPVFLCKHPLVDLKDIWPRLKHFD